MELTPSQQEQIKTWGEQRDEWLKSISILKSQYEELVKKNQELLDSSTEIEHRMNQNIGRIKELETKENERESLLKKEISDLVIFRNSLEKDITVMDSLLSNSRNAEKEIQDRISFLTDVLNKLMGKSEFLEAVMAKVEAVSEENIRKIKLLFSSIEESTIKILDSHEKTASAAQKVSESLPSLLVESRKQVLDRPIIKKIKIK
jgi:DNA repair exonuclease SbcCD ATPase subunit